jgi:xanthine dehydrogenase accessory factor
VNAFADHLVVVRGGGDLGTGVAWRLRRVGFPVVVLDLERPLAVRRTVAFSTAIPDGSIVVDGLEAVRVDDPQGVPRLVADGRIPVIASDVVPDLPRSPSVIVDARLAKRVLDTTIDQAPFVVALGPGFIARRDCHAVVETKRGHHLGRVIWDGAAAPNTGVPGTLGGVSAQRVMRAQAPGDLSWEVAIGDIVRAGQRMGTIGGSVVTATIDGTVRGLIAPGPVDPNLKIGDIDPRGDPEASTEISDKSLSVAGGVLEAILVWLTGSGS